VLALVGAVGDVGDAYDETEPIADRVWRRSRRQQPAVFPPTLPLPKPDRLRPQQP
jgi:hypothetical protein